LGAQFAADVNRRVRGPASAGVEYEVRRNRDLFLGLHGAHQGTDAAVALVAAERWHGGRLPEPAVRAAFAAPDLPGRMQLFAGQPVVVLDGAKNPAGLRTAVRALRDGFATPGQSAVVVGLLTEHDPQAMLALRRALVLVCAPPTDRAHPADQVHPVRSGSGCPPQCAPDPRRALAQARARACASVVLVAGSLYLTSALQPLATPTGA